MVLPKTQAEAQDVGLNPFAISRLFSRDKIWAADDANGMIAAPGFDYSSPEKACEEAAPYAWWYVHAVVCTSVVAAIERMPARFRNRLGRRVHGAQADAWYVPARLAHEMAELLQIMSEEGAWLEAAIPTVAAVRGPSLVLVCSKLIY